MPTWIQILKEELSTAADNVVPVDPAAAVSAVRDLRRSMREVVAREVLPSSSPVDFRHLLAQAGIIPSEVLLVTAGISTFDEPFKATWSDYFLDNQDAFWLPGDDVGFFDETLSWVVMTGDDGQTLLARAPQ